MAVTLVTVTGKFGNPDSTASVGDVLFKLTEPFANTGTIYHQTTITAVLNGSGAFSQVLVANNDTGSSPNGTAYTVTEQIHGASEREYQIIVPATAPSGTIDLSTLMPNTPPGIG